MSFSVGLWKQIDKEVGSLKNEKLIEGETGILLKVKKLILLDNILVLNHFLFE